MVVNTKAERKFQSLFYDPNLGLAILKNNKICPVKLFNRFWFVQRLDLYNSDISSLKGIEIFRNLKKLNIEGNNIVDITPLLTCENLKS